MTSFALVAIAAGLLLLFFGGLLFRRRFRLVGSLATSTGLLGILAGAVIFLIALNVATYQRLTHEIPIARVSVLGGNGAGYQVRLEDLRRGTQQDLPLKGDEWQLDARFIKWKGWATVLGRDPLVRLERISSRYRDTDQARRTPPSVHSLMPRRGLDLWQLTREFTGLGSWVDAYYGSAVYLPLKPGARYEVRATPSGLLARPLNGPGRTAVANWR